jgi:hypothetical protein
MTLEIKGPALLLMRPDNMTCLVPDLSGVERMPVKRLKNINPKDSMPNRLRVIPLMPGPDIRMVPPATHK